jgi:hypothetical protein
MASNNVITLKLGDAVVRFTRSPDMPYHEAFELARRQLDALLQLQSRKPASVAGSSSDEDDAGENIEDTDEESDGDDLDAVTQKDIEFVTPHPDDVAAKELVELVDSSDTEEEGEEDESSTDPDDIPEILRRKKSEQEARKAFQKAKKGVKIGAKLMALQAYKLHKNPKSVKVPLPAVKPKPCVRISQLNVWTPQPQASAKDSQPVKSKERKEDHSDSDDTDTSESS